MGLKDWLLRSGRNSGSADIAGCYADIQRWEDIYNGGGDWRYARRGGIQGGTRKLASLGAARALCGELARLCHGGYFNVLLRQRYRELREPGSH